jgi:hypothetical protein
MNVERYLNADKVSREAAIDAMDEDELRFVVKDTCNHFVPYEDALANPDGTILEPREVAKMLETAFAESCKGKAKIDLLQQENASLKSERDTLKKDYFDLQCQYEMYGGDEGITGMLEQISALKSERDVAMRAIESAQKLISSMKNNKKAALWLKEYGNENEEANHE